MHRCSLQFEAKEVAVGCTSQVILLTILVVIIHAVALKEGNDCIRRFKDLAKMYQMPEGNGIETMTTKSPLETKDWPTNLA